MGTILIIVAVLAIGGAFAYFGMKSGKIEDKNNNNIPDAIEEKIEEVKEVAVKVKKVADKAKKVAKTVVVEKKKPAAKKPAAKKTK
jgi:flagellar basal body-associated protein FliL